MMNTLMLRCFLSMGVCFFLFSSSLVYAQGHESHESSGIYYPEKLWVKLHAEAADAIASERKAVRTADFIDYLNDESLLDFRIVQVQKPFYFAKSKTISEIYEIQFEGHPGQEQRLAEILMRLPAVQYAERIPIMRTTLTPNDLGTATGAANQYGLWQISAQQAWDISTGSAEIKVAIVDDAVLVTHPDLAPNIVPGYDVSQDDDDPMPNDPAMTHGTHVAGIVGAATDNNLGVASIGFNVSIMPVKSSNSPQFVSDAYAGVVWAADNEADVINMSWGGSGFSQTGQEIINYAYSRGCVNVAAAGNDNVSSVFYPAGYDNVISVASTANGDVKSSFSNYGSWVDISAPGSNIRSTYHNAFSPSYASISGTSMASPMVAGLAALVLSVNPELPQSQVTDCILNTADNIDASNPNFIGLLGSGRINAFGAVLCAQATLTAPPIAAVSIQNNVVCPGNVVQYFGSSTGGLATSYQWSFPGGNPEASSAQNPVVVYSSPGTYDVALSVSNDFGNDQSVFAEMVEVSSNGIDLFFSADFEESDLNAAGWSSEGDAVGIGWQMTTVAGSLGGNRAAGIQLFGNAAIGERYGLISPNIDLSQHTNVQLDFQHAHRRRVANVRDSLIVYVSTDGGLSFPNRIFAIAENGQGSFATGTILSQNFIPTNGNDWCFGGEIGSGCFTLNLSDFDGEDQVRIKFEAYNNGGNNIFLDNVQISGNCLLTQAAPIAAVQASDQGICVGETVQFFDASINVPSSFEWYFPGGEPSTSSSALPEVTYSEQGSYDVILAVENEFGQDSIALSGYIQVSNPPVLQIETDASNICLGETVTLTAVGADAYTWQPPNALSSLDGASVVASPAVSTNFQVTGSVNGCTSMAEVLIEVLPSPPNPVYLTENEVAFVVTTPVESQGYYSFAPPAAGWSSPNLADVSVEAPMRIARDASVADSLLCQPASSTTDLQGRIAVVYRGGCEFGVKALNAQIAGAIGVIVVNNVPGDLLNMAPGGNGPLVTVPVMMVSQATGAHLNEALNQDQVQGIIGVFNGGSLTLCPGETARIAVQGGQDQYLWNTGHEGGLIEVTEPGIYDVEMGNSACSVEGEEIIVLEHATIVPQIALNQNGQAEVLNDTEFVTFQWFFNGDPLLGATESTLSAVVNGSYSVFATDQNGCSTTSDAVEIVLSAPESWDGAGQLAFYPNPSSRLVHLSVPETFSVASISFIDVQGKVLLQQNMRESHNNDFNIEHFAPGIYIIQVAGMDGTALRGRLVKVR